MGDFEEDKIWQANGEAKWQEEVGKQLPTILEEAEAENSLEADVSNSFGNDGDQSNLFGQPETNAEEKLLGGVELVGGISQWAIQWM